MQQVEEPYTGKKRTQKKGAAATSHDLQQPGTLQVHHGSKVEPLHLVVLAPPPPGMRSCMQSSAGGLLPLLLLLLATEGTSTGEEAARSEESSELLEQDDFLVRNDAAG